MTAILQNDTLLRLSWCYNRAATGVLGLTVYTCTKEKNNQKNSHFDAHVCEVRKLYVQN